MKIPRSGEAAPTRCADGVCVPVAPLIPLGQEAIVTTTTDILGRVWTADDTAIRVAVCARLHYSCPERLADADWYGVRLLADGFGDLTQLPQTLAQECIGDWSHVRDSSPEAFRAMSAYLTERGL
jgi:hypothetical protein